VNLVETWVTNITDVKVIPTDYGTLFELIADTNCYGCKKNQWQFTVTESEYDSIKNNGYYLT